MRVKILASGSKGNSYILEANNQKLLIECGINFKEVKKALNFDFKNVLGCLLTHCHQDHSKALNDVLKAGIEVYTSKGTAGELKHHRLHHVKSKEQFVIGDFKILAFDVQHDAEEPLGFLIQDTKTGEKLLFATDTYYLKYKFKGLNYIMIECNYITEILEENIEKGYIPNSLKNRLLESHFSFNNVKAFLQANDLKEVRKIILLHLSEGNSDIEIMKSEIENLTGIETVVAEKGLKVELELYPF